MITYFYFKILTPVMAILMQIASVLEPIGVVMLFFRNQKNIVKVGHQTFGVYTTKHVWAKLQFTKENLKLWGPYYLAILLLSFYSYSFFNELYSDPNYESYIRVAVVIILPWIAPIDYQRVKSIKYPIWMVKTYWMSSLFFGILGIFAVNFPNLFDKYEILIVAVWAIVSTLGIIIPLFFLSVDTILIPWYRKNLKEKKLWRSKS